MTKLAQVMTVPTVRRKFAPQLGIFGVAIGMTNLVLVFVLAALAWIHFPCGATPFLPPTSTLTASVTL